MKRRFTDAEKSRMAELFDAGQSVRDIAKAVSSHHASVSYVLRKRGVDCRAFDPETIRRLNEETAEVVRLYQSGKPTPEIAEKFGVTDTTIQNRLRAVGIPCRDCSHARRIYGVNECFFDRIDNEAKAYFFGLVCADGHVNAKSNALIVSLKSTDRATLEAMRSAMGFTGNIREHISGGSRMASLAIINKRLNGALKRLGCWGNKTVNLCFPTGVPERLMHHFVRGFFDGDGCMYAAKTHRHAFSVVGTWNFLAGLQQELALRGMPSTIRPQVNIFCLKIQRRALIARVFWWMYRDATLWLPRKFNKFVQIGVTCGYQLPLPFRDSA